MTAATRAFQLPGTHALEWVRDRVAQALEDWSLEWVLRHAHEVERSVSVSVTAAADMYHLQVHEYQTVTSAAGSIWIRSTSRERLTVSSAVVGADLLPRSTCADDWVAGVVESAWNARNRQLASALLGEISTSAFANSPTALPRDLLAAGSGSLHVACEELGLHAFVDAGVWRAAPRERRGTAPLPPLVPIERAIERATAQLDVVLGTAELELPKVLDLRCGDVLCLSQRLDNSIAVFCEGQPLARAALGRIEDRLSIQIQPSHP